MNSTKRRIYRANKRHEKQTWKKEAVRELYANKREDWTGKSRQKISDGNEEDSRVLV